MSLPVIILAGGLATRLRPLSETIPKSLVEVAGEPFVSHQMRLLRSRGICRVVFCLGYFGEQVASFLGDGSQFGLDISYVFDGPTLRGTAGAIVNALPHVGEDFFILYGDSYLECDYAGVEKCYRASGQPALMTIFANFGRWDTSNIEYDGKQIKRYDKTAKTDRMQYIDYGLGVAHRSVFAGLSDTVPTDLAQIYSQLVDARRMAALEVRNRFFEVGSFAGIAELSKHLEGSRNMTYAQAHLREASEILNRLDVNTIESAVDGLVDLRSRGGRLFFLGVGGSAANCSHAVNDFRKIVGIESYAPTDNVSELTARTNDEGWETVFAAWLKGSRLCARDAVFVMSVGGGNREKNISPNLVLALEYAKTVGATIFGIVGRDGGYTTKVGDHVVIVPTVNADTITPHSEAFQAVIWHLFVSHPKLKSAETKWESAVR